MKRSAVLLLTLLACACGEDSHADELRALTGSGFTDVKFTGYEFFACGNDDFYHTGFTAKGPTGVPVTGVVCCSLGKGCTVRF